MLRIIVVLLISIISLTGCSRQERKQQSITQPKAQVPKPAPLVVTVPEYLKSYFELAGGQQAWSETQVITGKCTARVFEGNGQVYLTELQVALYPWSDTIRVAATEPQGRFVWELFRQNLRIIQGQQSWINQIPLVLRDKANTEAIWSIIAPPSRLAVGAMDRENLPQPVMIDGMWYYPIRISTGRTYFLNRASGIIDMCLIPTEHGQFLLVRGYNHRPVVESMIKLPYRAEIYRADSRATPEKLLASYDFSQLRTERF